MSISETPIAVATTVEGTSNPYTVGVYAPVPDEITADNLMVMGEIPKDLNGVYLRNGPNRQFDAPGRYHLFDGDGMIHAVHFENGKARYQTGSSRRRPTRRSPKPGTRCGPG